MSDNVMRTAADDVAVYGSLKQACHATLLCILGNRSLREKAGKASGKSADESRSAQMGALIHGESGIGKNAVTDGLTDMLNAIGMKRDGKRVEWGFHDENLANSLPEDHSGIPVAGGDVVKYLPRKKFDLNSFGILRLDEMDRPAFLQTLIAAVKWCLDRTTEHFLPWNWFTLGLCNGTADSGTVPLTKHLNGRFCHLYVSANSPEYQAEFLAYMQKAGWEQASIQLATLNPVRTADKYKNSANPCDARSRAFADAVLTAYKRFNGKKLADGTTLEISKHALLMALAGCEGQPLALQHLTLEQVASLPTLADVTADSTGVAIPADIDLRIKHIESLVASAKAADVDALCQYIARLPPELARSQFQTFALRFADVKRSGAYGKWSSRNG